MKNYIVYFSDGEILEQHGAIDSHTLYNSARYRVRQLREDSYYNAAFGVHSDWYPWQLSAVCFLKEEDTKKFVWAFHSDVFFGEMFMCDEKTSKPIIEHTFKEEYYKDCDISFLWSD